ncbi:MAG: sigma-54 dependent transcriptional regulator, partial [Myxococcota bacterium]
GKVAPTEATILLQGETGTGKGAVTRAIHKQSKRSDNPFVVFDCGAVASNLVESELFGHERGAFTGAVQQRRGALEQAQGGTLFIDELAELALELQPKLLRALEEREFSRVGSHKPLKVDCRIIAASQRDLWDEVSAGRFREDLYFRLAVVTVPLPALRERQEDIPMLVDRFLNELGKEGYEKFEALEPDLQRKLISHDWPGNLRELRNTVERIALMEGADPFIRRPRRDGERETEKSTIEGDVLAADYSIRFKDAKEQLVSAFEQEYLTRLLSRTNNNIAKAAREAGIDRKYLYTLLAKHGLGNEN